MEWSNRAYKERLQRALNSTDEKVPLLPIRWNLASWLYPGQRYLLVANTGYATAEQDPLFFAQRAAFFGGGPG